MLNQIKQLTDPKYNKSTEKQTHMASALLIKKRQELTQILGKIGDTKPMQYVFNEVNAIRELTAQMYSRIDKKWIPVGICGIGAAGAVIGLSFWLLRNRAQKKEQIVKEFLSSVRKEAIKKNPSASKLQQIGNKLIEDCNKYIFTGKGGIEKQIKLANENSDHARQFAGRACEILLEVVSEALLINLGTSQGDNIQDNKNKLEIKNQQNENKVWEETTKLILKLLMHYLALSKQYQCPLLSGLLGRVISTEIQVKKNQQSVTTPAKETNDSTNAMSSWLKVVVQNSGYLSSSTSELLIQFIAECPQDVILHFHTLIAANSYQLVQNPVSVLVKVLYNLSSSQMDSLVDSGGAIAVIASFCGLLQQQNKQLLEFSAPISSLLPLAKLVLQAGLQNVLFRDIAGKLLLEALAFSETAETITIKSDSNVVDLVQWSTSHLGFILNRLKTSRIIESMLLTILSYDQTCPKQIGSRYLDQLRWMHQIRQTDKSKGFQQFDIDLSVSGFFPQILLHSIKQLPSKDNLNAAFSALIPCIDQQERTVILKTITNLFHNYFFTKEIFHSMLQKTSSLNATDIMTFADFSQAFYSPKGKKYDESMLALQFAVLLGGGDALSENLAKRWRKDAESYHDFKIYMESDIAFFLQVLENDLCFLNVNASEFSAMRDAQAIQDIQLNTQHKIQKLLVNYLHIFGALDKDSLKQQLKNQIDSSIIENEMLFSDALQTVAVVNESGPKKGLYQLKESLKLKFFHSLFSRDIPLLVSLLDKISEHQKHAGFVLNHDLHTEAQLREEDEPLVYLKQVRKCILENIQLHTAFREIFIEKEEIFLDKMRVACRILHYIFDIIEEGIIASRATKKLTSNSIKSLLVQYVFDPVIAEKIDHVTSLRDEKGHVIVSAFAPTLNNIIFRREAIKDLLKDIFKGFKISDIIV